MNRIISRRTSVRIHTAVFLAATLTTIACQGNRNGEKAVINYDTLAATQVNIATELYLEGSLHLSADTGTFVHTSGGEVWSVLPEGIYPSLQSMADSLGLTDKVLSGQFRGVLVPTVAQKDGRKQVRITQVVQLDVNK
ncbi:MAG: hypothetical protein ACI36X_04270 [Bacteroidaceae bacterium]